MKKITIIIAAIIATLAIIIFSGFRQNTEHTMSTDYDNYDAEWRTIDSLQQQGLPKSALKKTEALLTRAKSENNAPQTVKALVYYNKYQTQLEEDGYVKSIYRMEQEAEKAAFPAQPILQSMVGEMYQNYLMQNQYRIRNRTQTIGFQQDDVQTWTAEQLAQKAIDLYNASVTHERTQEVKLDDFNAILTEGKLTEKLRPTLYDFLAHRAIDFFMNERTYLTQPAYKFYIDQTEAFASAKTFAKHNFETKDKTSNKYLTILRLQELINFHLKDKTPDALIDADLKRLQFVHQNAVMSDKDDLYLKALEDLQNTHKNHPAYTEIALQIAQIPLNRGRSYKPSPEATNQFDIKKAYDILKAAAEKYPDSYGAAQCRNMMRDITQKSVNIQTEKVNPIDAPFLVKLNYKNTETVYIKTVEVSDSDLKKFENKDRNQIVQMLNSNKTIYENRYTLTDEGDYQNHSTELKVEGLPSGRYAVLVSENQKFNVDGDAVAYSFLNVSNIAFLKRDSQGTTEFYLVDRITGKPLEGVKAEFFAQNYDRMIRKYSYLAAGQVVSDKNGFIQKKHQEKRNRYKVKFTYKNDALDLDDDYYSYNNEHNPQSRKTTTFFTDRAIYRPGQTIYFKGLVMNIDTENTPSIAPNTAVTVTFKDANYQDVETLELRTNEYGTINGSFIAPSAGLMGRMQLMSSLNGNKQIRVEEYKRPKFEVKFDPVKESYRIGDKVTVKGKAQAYAGSNVDGAKVVYRVQREVRFPYWEWWRCGWYNPWQRPATEITNGETVTDATGAYNIEFDALPDRSIPADQKPQFTYKITADITDITGETRSTTTRVQVGYIALSADIDVPEKLNRDDLKAFAISTKNLNGEFEPASGTIKVEKLRAPTENYIKRYWDRPDKQIIPEAEFKRDFPLYAYANEDEVQNWKVEKSVIQDKFDTSKEKEFLIDKKLKKSDVGHYKVTFNTADKYGEKIEIIKYFVLYDLNEKKVPANVVDFHIQDKSKAEPVETVNIYFGSAEKNIHILYEKELAKNNLSAKWFTPNSIQKESINIEEKHRGNIFYKLSFVKNNRAYTSNHTIAVPWSNKDLNIEYATFRDKLLPGQDEEWQIKISGSKGDKVAAEMLASMYDASLDVFVAHSWQGVPGYPGNAARQGWSSNNNFTQSRGNVAQNYNDRTQYKNTQNRVYPGLNWFGFSAYGYRHGGVLNAMAGGVEMESVTISRARGKRKAKAARAPMAERSADSAVAYSIVADEDELVSPKSSPPPPPPPPPGEEAPIETDFSNVKVRTNLNETVFFFPELQTDAEGSVIIKFKMNEALTRWKFMGFAHTKDYEYAFTEKEIVTQKELMVMPNPPRFFREGDEIYFSAKVSNLSENDLNGTAKLELFNALTMQPIDTDLGNTNASQNFSVAQGQSAPLAWKLDIPEGIMAVTWRVVAKAGNFSDGEESTLPVLTNRMLVTETLPLPVRGNETKTFTFKAMEKAAASKTLTHHKMTLEFTSNPAWYAVQALPYLMEYPHDCTEQIFSRFYANSLASSVADSHPKVQRVFEQWRNTDAMLSNLSKNEELKTALLTETPWVLNAQSEEQQKKRIGLLFDLNKMSNEQDIALQKMIERQDGNGGFSWFPGGRDSWYITQHIVSGMGHLDKLGVKALKEDKKANQMMTKSVNYIDNRLAEHYNEMKKNLKKYGGKLEDDHLDRMAIHYLYTRSFFGEIPIPDGTQEAFDYYVSQSEKYWTDKGLYSQGMIALSLHRNNKLAIPANIIKSLKERSLNNEEMGMYWKYNRGYYWYQHPIETHSLMIEVFRDVAQDDQAVDDLKVWLLKNKQTNHWRTTKATSSAVYALLMSGSNWLLEDDPVKVKVGTKTIDQSQLKTEAGTGYFKTSWDGKAIENSMSKVEVTNPNDVVAWGAMYWQYFEQLDKITTFEDTPLTLKKQLFREENTDTGPAIRPLATGTPLTPGDKLKVRIELRVDRDMEYIHMKDMRAAGFEPVNVLSQYKWQGGLGYYESTRDAATHFFMERLPKGTYVFEYPLRVQHAGDFSNGIATIQCMYAPEFTSHSEGIKVQVQASSSSSK